MTTEKGWKHYIFKRNYPSWIYYIIFTAYAVALFLWIWKKYF
ncbi:MAG: hypothetical protein ACE5D2_06500 [Fidelibacterota bacterium]